MDDGPNAKADPFCVVGVGGESCEREVYRTKVVKKTLDPSWNEHLQVLLADAETGGVELRLFDWDAGVALSKADPMGVVRLSAAELLSPLDVDGWYSIQPTVDFEDAQGQVHLKCTFR